MPLLNVTNTLSQRQNKSITLTTLLFVNICIVDVSHIYFTFNADTKSADMYISVNRYPLKMNLNHISAHEFLFECVFCDLRKLYDTFWFYKLG